MARTVIYECRRCDVRVSEPISSYVDHPNDWVYEAGLCDACSEIAEQELLSELLNRPSAQQPADLAPGTTTLTFNVDDLPEYQPTIRTHAHELAPDPRDVELERLRKVEQAARSYDDFVLKHGEFRIKASPPLAAQRHLLHKDLHDALQASPERPAADTDNDA